MCGICGLVTLDGAPDAGAVDAMRAAIRHRGPDEGSSDRFGACVLGHQRLRVLDLETGSQPVTNENGGVAAVFNGELYNYGELRESLRGHEVRGTGDTPVLPHLYEEHGLGFVERLGGMFAVALWDDPRGRLVLARDRLGKKPLLWTRLPDGTVAFASELKALLQLPALRREVDLDVLDAYLALGYVPPDASPLRGVNRLQPASLLVFEGGDVKVERYWEPAPAEPSGSDEEWLERVRDTVTGAVCRRLASDVPLGALLSGGIDSTIAVALMAEASSQPVRTFTVGFTDERYDERRYARAVAERYATEHEEIFLEPDVAATLERLAAAFDEPLGDEAALPLFLICEQARRRVTVALTGDGGDESFAGYERYAAAALAERLPSRLSGAAAAGLRLLPAARAERRSTLFRAARLLEAAAKPGPARYASIMEVFPAPLRRELLGRGRATADILGAPPAPGIAGLQLLDLATYLPGDLLVKSDIASMAHSLELRSPFLDHEVVELGLALPDRLKLHGRTGKQALRRAFAPELEPVAGRGKLGFGLPLARWFREDLRDLAADLLGEPRSPIDAAAARRLLAEHSAGRADHGHRIWCLVSLELWHRVHLSGNPQPALSP
jgi:asparagine synthase (glutamine-hydrolysing)